MTPTTSFCHCENRIVDLRPVVVLSSDRIISLTGYFESIVPRGTRGSGQKKGAGGFAG